MAYKVFTNGSVLNASEINDNLMNQSVMVFSNATARSAALTAPVEGMLTWLEDVNRYENYNGSAWVALGVSGLEFITAQDFTGVASVSLGSDASPVFTSTYDNYKIIVQWQTSTDANRTIALRLRANTTDLSSSSYRFGLQGLLHDGSAFNANSAGATSMSLVSNAYYGDGFTSTINFDINGPLVLNEKSVFGFAQGSTGAATANQRIGGLVTSTAAYNGFTLLNSSGNFVNTRVMVYGYRRA